MALQNDGLGEIPLLDQAQTDEVLLVDKLYAKAYNHFEVCVIISGIYSILKACVAPFIIAVSQPQYPQLLWLILLIPLSFMQFVYYCKAWKVARNRQVFLRVASVSQHAAYFFVDEVSEIALDTNVHDHIANLRNMAAQDIADRQIKILSLEIKYEVLRTDWTTMLVSRVLFVIYTALHIWGYLIFVLNDQQPSLADYFIVVIFFLGTYQYLQIYLAMVGFLLFLPFFLIYLLVRELKKRSRTRKIVRMLRGKEYNPEAHKGQNLCHICMDDYKEKDMLIVLPCNEMHHFHQPCLNQWIKVSNTCPLCRVDIQIQ